MVKSLPDAPQRSGNGIPAHNGRFYGQSTKTDANVRRLRAICRMFGLGPTAVAKAAGRVVGSAQFYTRLEARLGQVIDQRQTQFFRVSPLSVRRIEGAVELASR